MATAQTNAGIIAREVKEQGNVLFVDLEWTRNTDEGPGTIGIGLKDGSVHLFHVPTIGGIPAGIKALMEEPTIQKVGNRFHCDIKKFREVGITVSNAVELGKMAKARGIFNRGNSSLGDQSMKLLDVTLPKENVTRCSQWNSKKELTEEQIQYAITDVYATRSVWLTLNAMPWIDPFGTASPKREELQQGTEVLVYAKNCSQLVAHGTVSSEMPNDAFDRIRERKMVRVRIQRNDVLVPITKTCIDSKKTLDDLFMDNDGSSGADGCIDTPWKWESLRVMPEGAKQNGNESNII
jgi:ribonuclease D